MLFNLVEIALGNDFTSIDYITDKKEEIDNPDPKRQKVIFETLSKKKKVHIDLMKDYFENNYLNPLQDYLDRLFEN